VREREGGGGGGWGGGGGGGGGGGVVVGIDSVDVASQGEGRRPYPSEEGVIGYFDFASRTR